MKYFNEQKQIEYRKPLIKKIYTADDIRKIDLGQLSRLSDEDKVNVAAFYRHEHDFDKSSRIISLFFSLEKAPLDALYVLVRNAIDGSDFFHAEKILSLIKKRGGENSIRYQVTESILRIPISYDTKVANSICEAYFINMPNNLHRKSVFLQRANKFGFPVERFEGVDIDSESLCEFSTDFINRRLDKGDKGALGCWLSHMRLWQKLVKSKQPYYLIFEDDAYLRFNPNYIFSNLNLGDLDFLYVNDRTEKSVLKANGLSVDDLNSVTQYRSNPDYFHPGKEGKGTDGYIISKVGAEKLLSVISENKIEVGLDQFMKATVRSGCVVTPSIKAVKNGKTHHSENNPFFKACAMTPALVEHRDGYSNRLTNVINS